VTKVVPVSSVAATDSSGQQMEQKSKNARRFSRVTNLKSLANMAVLMDRSEKKVEEHTVSKAMLDKAVHEKNIKAHARLAGRIAKRNSIGSSVSQVVTKKTKVVSIFNKPKTASDA
jgi:hypothetical protein